MSFNQTIQDFLYPDEDGHRSCAGCGAIAGRGHVDPCPVEQLEALDAAYEYIRSEEYERRLAAWDQLVRELAQQRTAWEQRFGTAEPTEVA